MSVLQYEKEKYEELYAAVPDYNSAYSPAEAIFPLILMVIDHLKCNTILDASCGKGQIIPKLLERGHKVIGTDITLSGITDEKILKYCIETPTSSLPLDTDSIDLTICCDALEHYPKEENVLYDSLKEISRVTTYALFKISMHKDSYGKRIGKVLHQTIMTATEWVSLLNKYFTQVQILEDTGGNITILCVK